MDIIRGNPYRFLGIYSNSPTKERVANSNRLKAFLKVGKTVDFLSDLSNLIPAPTRTIEELEQVGNSINLPKDQLKHALFWFINDSSIDAIALEYLQKGNSEKALELFEKKESFSSLINAGVLAFIQAKNGKAIASISKVIHNEEFRLSFVEKVCGSAFQISEEELSKIFIDELLNGIAIKQLMQLFEEYGTSEEDDNYLKEKAINEPIAAINNAILEARNVSKDNANIQYNAGVKLMTSTKSAIIEVKSLLGINDVKYQMLADNLAKQILQCGINYYNYADEEEEIEIDKAYKLQNYALSIAVGNLTKDRCKENVDILKKKKAELPPIAVKEYDKVIRAELLKYQTLPNLIKYAIDLIKKCAPHLMSIKEELGSTNSYYLELSTLIVKAALYKIIKEFNSVNNKDIQIKLLLDREGTIRKVRSVFTEAWTATLYMDKLDMKPDFRRDRYAQNRSSLQDQVSGLGISLYQKVELDLRYEEQNFAACKNATDYSNYMSIFPNGKFLSQAKTRIERCEFDACKTTQDCERFQKKYPYTTLPLKTKWEDCYFSTCKTIANLQVYLNAYPTGRYVTQAKDKIDKMSYEACCNVSDYKQYLNRFSSGKYRTAAQQIIADEELWQQCVASGIKEQYKNYLAQFPNGRHKAEAEQKASACYVATMVYGDYNHPQVVALRTFRDESLSQTFLGCAFIRFYYRYSPKWVEYMQNRRLINSAIRKTLDNFIKLYNHESK